ncbi:hypothetical protein [Helicobacter pullorum]|uniref:hypothetical protein n=1 Tax=Helicobacter pullorum TaxID=35818 RepID=UPI001F0CF6FD|nr:hypothetical protein [Helicobacter pullorum]
MIDKIVGTIEQRRNELKTQSQMVEVIDFGAGNPSDKRSKKQMEMGVKVEIPLRDLAKIGVKKEKAECIYTVFFFFGAQNNPRAWNLLWIFK